MPIWEEEATRSTAHLLRFLLFFTIAQSNVLSSAYLTVHRIGHTRVTAIAVLLNALPTSFEMSSKFIVLLRFFDSPISGPISLHLRAKFRTSERKFALVACALSSRFAELPEIGKLSTRFAGYAAANTVTSNKAARTSREQGREFY